jgi:hypothetical protein
VASTRLADVPPCVAAPYGLAGHHRAAGHQAWRIRSDEKIIVDILKKMLVQNLDRNIFLKKMLKKIFLLKNTEEKMLVTFEKC